MRSHCWDFQLGLNWNSKLNIEARIVYCKSLAGPGAVLSRMMCWAESLISIYSHFSFAVLLTSRKVWMHSQKGSLAIGGTYPATWKLSLAKMYRLKSRQKWSCQSWPRLSLQQLGYQGMDSEVCHCVLLKSRADRSNCCQMRMCMEEFEYIRTFLKPLMLITCLYTACHADQSMTRNCHLK